MTNLEQRLANLSPEQRALLLRKINEQHVLAGRQGKHSRLQPITALPRGQTFPLSFAQQRVWFLHQLGSGAAYNLPAMLKLSGRLDVAALQQSLSEIIRRHETLRTTFSTIDGETRQVIHEKNAVELPLINLQHLLAEARETSVKQLATDEALRPFDLACDLMLRAKLLQLGPDEHVLLLTMHHIASDGWSLGILVGELTVLYAAFSHDKSAPLPELPIQYADFAVWQRQWLQGEILETQLSYWRDRLADAPQLLPFPTDRPRPSNQTFRGGLVPISVDAELTRLLHQLSRRAEATLFMTL
ncbi:MAG: non-ribosomal peptide synthetase, partial [Anaerolineae bacterium]|nr:non-ribosomal peptide synthetase [Anaerolineae bacterium]